MQATKKMQDAKVTNRKKLFVIALLAFALCVGMDVPNPLLGTMVR